MQFFFFPLIGCRFYARSDREGECERKREKVCKRKRVTARERVQERERERVCERKREREKGGWETKEGKSVM